MYRIIGINSSGQLKLIKKEALNTSYAWNSTQYSNVSWPNSNLYKGINGSYFLSNTSYISSGWSNKIATTSWKYGDNTTYQTPAANLYSIENGWTANVTAKIGLIYAHDYYYGLNGGNDCSVAGPYTTCTTSWIYLWNSGNDSGAPNSEFEWTMSRYGFNSDYFNDYRAWTVYERGNLVFTSLAQTQSVRPVFYLTPDISYISGIGTLSDPIIIN